MAAAGKVELAGEPSMEDLLASIRRAITDDVNAAAVGNGGGAVRAGADRQSFRAKLEDSIANDKAALDARKGEILELRGKVAGQLAQGANRFDANRYDPPLDRRNGFAGLLGGGPEPAPLRYDPPPVDLRPSVQDDDYAYGRREPEPRMWQPEEPAQPRYRAEPQYRLGYAPPPPPAASMMSPGPTAQANAAFNQLAETLMARALGDRSIEQMTQELLRGMLRQWLDDNLPPLVERLVREEIERVARRGPAR